MILGLVHAFSDNRLKLFVCYRFFCNKCQIISCCVLIRIMQTVWIYKMALFGANRFGSLVHHFGKIRYRLLCIKLLARILSGDIGGNRSGRIIS
ncbi:hypothetical protein D3C78_1643830 [compost metagenome]